MLCVPVVYQKLCEILFNLLLTEQVCWQVEQYFFSQKTIKRTPSNR